FDITVNDVKAGSSQSRQDDQFSPRAGLIFKPQDSLSLYISYSESFLPRSGEQYKKLSASSARLDPDVFENTEFGVKWDIAPGLMFAAAYFQNDQTQAVRDSVTGEQAEIVGLQVDGFELELKGQLNDSLSVAAGYTSMDGTTSSGGEPRELPESTMHLWANYQVNAQFGLGVGFAYQDEQNIKNNKPGLILPDYTRWDAAAYYNVSDDLEIRLNVENLSDELYFPFSHSTHQASVGKDLNARLSITRRF
ncbi:MAG: TonB-dependent receptor, partial [Pseudomonadota bacterium]|nr:TonB-dependent receptor [Pseudomonadota bacterium]